MIRGSLVVDDASDEELTCRPLGMEFLASLSYLGEKHVFGAPQGGGLSHRLIQGRLGQIQKLYSVDEVVDGPRIVDDPHYLAPRLQDAAHLRGFVSCDSHLDVRWDRVWVVFDALENPGLVGEEEAHFCEHLLLVRDFHGLNPSIRSTSAANASRFASDRTSLRDTDSLARSR